ncbi:MAG: diaminopimelate epimerase [Planctomycetota bacterium]
MEAPRVPFVKMHGLGNDYVFIDFVDERDLTPPDPPRWARVLSDRHAGIGADGLIIMQRDPEHPCRMEIYNADGSRAEMCGNGIRCVARLAWERRYASSEGFAIGTDSGPRAVEILREQEGFRGVRVAMGIPRFEELELELDLAAGSARGSVLTLGNPHFVVELDLPPEAFPVREQGPLIERHPRFPGRTNVAFARVRGRDRIDLRVWERGSGETRACGTGAAAAVAALERRGRTGRRVTVELAGGALDIEITESGEIWMTGPAEESFRGSFARELVEGAGPEG